MVNSLPKVNDLTLAGVKMVSCWFCPERALSLCQVKTFGWACSMQIAVETVSKRRRKLISLLPPPRNIVCWPLRPYTYSGRAAPEVANISKIDGNSGGSDRV